MRLLGRREFCGSALAFAAMGGAPAVSSASSVAKRWYKGMLHCHCYWSDGRAFPEQGAKAYYDAGYHFYCMSDHNRLGKNPDYWRDVCEDEGAWPKNVYRPIFESYRKAFPDAEIRERDGDVLRLGKVTVDAGGGVVVEEGREIARLTRTELDLLKVFCARRGETLVTDDLITELRGNGYACEDSMLFSHVYHLRGKLGSAAALLVHRRGLGYCLVK